MSGRDGIGSEAPRTVGQRGPRPVWQRFGAMVALAVLVLGTLSACGDDNTRPYTHISPTTGVADDIQGLYKLVFWMALVVFVLVQFLIVYAAMRFRRKRNQNTRPPQIHGNKTLEIAWTIIPALVLLTILVPTIQTMYEFDAQADEVDDALVVNVYGKQWWWEVHYPQFPVSQYRSPADGSLVGEPQVLMTANEVRVPVGRKVRFNLYSNNVIHSFYIPRMSGKMDVIPGHENYLAFTPREVGTFYGECTEFCGVSHAWMRFVVKAVEPAQFDAWVAAYSAPPSVVSQQFSTDGDVTKPPASFGLCVTCHNVNGTTAGAARGGLATDPTSVNAAPNLTLFGCRDTIAAGLLENTPENLATWLDNPAAVKEGNFMSSAIKDETLTDEQITELVNYLESLKPAEGCYEPPGGEGGPTNPDVVPVVSSVPVGQQPALPAPPPVAS
ncbi:MAG: Cytochrome c oxidase polypeptide II [uncultured Thermomicrobiales bacterium]|uniref:Cytochrome c oxidase subunit 2 n=1 Tax=uncultured Thermomicrobiales bacterium TaxID=1645740 RepID=A0A6J4V1A8_9BACT|nr:MAG: Cytochrome c oxidase polypeptide II [uncultured Thermomicrobiales bacterium]